MKITGHDLVKIRLPLLAALLLLVIAGLLAWWSASEANKAQRQREAAASRNHQIEQRLRQARTEEQELKERAQRFLQLQATDIAGEEKRLEWTEMLRAIQQEQGIPGMNYEFGIQTPLESINGASHAWFASPLRLELRLLHEEDLLKFLADIEKNAKALVLVRHCKLERLAPTGNSREAQARLKASCDLQWLTAHRTGGKT